MTTLLRGEPIKAWGDTHKKRLEIDLFSTLLFRPSARLIFKQVSFRYLPNFDVITARFSCQHKGRFIGAKAVFLVEVSFRKTGCTTHLVSLWKEEEFCHSSWSFSSLSASTSKSHESCFGLVLCTLFLLLFSSLLFLFMSNTSEMSWFFSSFSSFELLVHPSKKMLLFQPGFCHEEWEEKWLFATIHDSRKLHLLWSYIYVNGTCYVMCNELIKKYDKPKETGNDRM